MTNPDFDSIAVHYSAIEGSDDEHYPNSDEKLSVIASFSAHFGLMRLGIHHETLKPGRRLSWPHAEADEEEFVYVIEGEPDLWLDGYVKKLTPGDGAAFVPGTGVSHTFINNTEKDVRLLVFGEASRQRSRIHYPLHPERNREIGSRHWKSCPAQKLGPHDGKPDRRR